MSKNGKKVHEMKASQIVEKYKFRFDVDGFLTDCRIPRDIAACPNCGRQLEACADSWTFDENNNPFPDDLKVYCIRYCNNLDTLVNRMPYVYWLPKRTAAERWVNEILTNHFYPPPATLAELEDAGQQTLFF